MNKDIKQNQLKLYFILLRMKLINYKSELGKSLSNYRYFVIFIISILVPSLPALNNLMLLPTKYIIIENDHIQLMLLSTVSYFSFSALWVQVQKKYISDCVKKYYILSLPLPKTVHIAADISILIISDLLFWLVLAWGIVNIDYHHSLLDTVSRVINSLMLLFLTIILQFTLLNKDKRKIILSVVLILLFIGVNSLREPIASVFLFLSVIPACVGILVLNPSNKSRFIFKLKNPLAFNVKPKSEGNILTRLKMKVLYYNYKSNLIAVVAGLIPLSMLGQSFNSYELIQNKRAIFFNITLISIACFVISNLYPRLKLIQDKYNKYTLSLPISITWQIYSDVIMVIMATLLFTAVTLLPSILMHHQFKTYLLLYTVLLVCSLSLILHVTQTKMKQHGVLISFLTTCGFIAFIMSIYYEVSV